MKKIAKTLSLIKDEAFLFALQALVLIIRTMSMYFSPDFAGPVPFIAFMVASSVLIAALYKRTADETKSSILLLLMLIFGLVSIVSSYYFTAKALFSLTMFMLSLFLVFPARREPLLSLASALLCCIGGFADRGGAVMYLPFLALVFVCENLIFDGGKEKAQKLIISASSAICLLTTGLLMMLPKRLEQTGWLLPEAVKSALPKAIPGAIAALCFFVLIIKLSPKENGKRSYTPLIAILFWFSGLLPYVALFFCTVTFRRAELYCVLSLALRLTAVCYLAVSSDAAAKKAVEAIGGFARRHWAVTVAFFIVLFGLFGVRIEPSSQK